VVLDAVAFQERDPLHVPISHQTKDVRHAVPSELNAYLLSACHDLTIEKQRRTPFVPKSGSSCWDYTLRRAAFA